VAAAAADQDTASPKPQKIKAMEERVVASRELEEITPKTRRRRRRIEQLHTVGITERIM
jgi:hypothetical protein